MRKIEKDFIKQFGKKDLQTLHKAAAEHRAQQSNYDGSIEMALLSAIDFECAGRFAEYHEFKKVNWGDLREFMRAHRKELRKVKEPTTYLGMLAGTFNFIFDKEAPCEEINSSC